MIATPPNYGLNQDVIDSYRRTLTFNNDLLVREFPERYEFRVTERTRKMRLAGASEKSVATYQEKAAKLKQKRWDLYRSKLAASVEPSVKKYADGIRGFLGLLEP